MIILVFFLDAKCYAECRLASAILRLINYKDILLFRIFLLRLLIAALLLIAQSAFASDSSDKTGDAVMRSLADQTTSQLARNELDAIYISISPKIKSVCSRDDLLLTWECFAYRSLQLDKGWMISEYQSGAVGKSFNRRL